MAFFIALLGASFIAALADATPSAAGEDPGSATDTPLVYPAAKRGNVVDDYHGVKVADPYRWLEQLDSPETRAWVSNEARITESYLEGLPSRLGLRQRLATLLNYEKYGVPFHKAGRYFYSYNSGLQEQSVLCMTEGLSGPPRVVLDPNLLSTNGSLAVVGYVVSEDAKRLAYGVSHGGSDWTDWRIRDLDIGRDLPDVLRWTKYYRPAFTANGEAVVYSAFPAPRAGDELRARDLNDAVYLHTLGTPSTADKKIYARPDHPDWQFEPHLTPDGRWLVVAAGEGEVGDKGLENLYLVDGLETDLTVVPLIEGFGAAYEYAGYDDGLLYFQTTLDAPRGRVIAIDPKTPDRAHWKDLGREGPDSMDMAGVSVSVVNRQIIVRTMHDAHTKVSVYGEDGRGRGEVSLPGLGVASGFNGEASDRNTFYVYADLATAPTIFQLELASRTSTVFRAPKIDFDLNTLETTQVFYTSKDGTRIPMYLVYKKGLKKDGNNPTLLYGYG
ncbi:MAG: S9 family peptidase, partial [Candidatus Dormibacteraceae bacterium]